MDYLQPLWTILNVWLTLAVKEDASWSDGFPALEIILSSFHWSFLSFACAELDWLSNPSFCVETVTTLSQQTEEAAALVSEGSPLTR